jgi:hypothetical protein
MNKIGILLLGALSLLANPPCFSQSKTFYLSPQGKDKADGSLNKPWKTASHAFQQINQITNGDITLIVQDGDYFLSDSLALNGKNHDGRITIMAANKGKANFIGYRTLTKFSKVKSKTERNCLAPNVQGHILRAKLRKAGIIDYLQAATEYNRFELYLNGKRQQLSRWPNDSSVKTGTVLGKTIDTKNKSIVEGFFKYTNPYIDKFAADDDLYLHGYFCYKWFDNIERVAKIDKINRTITIAKPRQDIIITDTKKAKISMCSTACQKWTSLENIMLTARMVIYIGIRQQLLIPKKTTSLSLSSKMQTCSQSRMAAISPLMASTSSEEAMEPFPLLKAIM